MLFFPPDKERKSAKSVILSPLTFIILPSTATFPTSK
jgi:hypothetical protein